MLVIRKQFMNLFHLLKYKLFSLPLRLMKKLKPRIEPRHPSTEECSNNDSNDANPSVHRFVDAKLRNHPLATASGSVSDSFGFQRSTGLRAAAASSRRPMRVECG